MGNIKAVILIDAGFDETAILTFLKLFRLHHISLRILSLTNRPQVGMSGLPVVSHLILETWETLYPYKPALIVVPEPHAHATRLFLDPRILRFIRETMVVGGVVWLTPKARSLLLAADLRFYPYREQLVNRSIWDAEGNPNTDLPPWLTQQSPS